MDITESIARKRQTARQREFLTHFALSGNVRQSAKQVRVSRALVYWWRENSPSFSEKLNAAADQAFGENESQTLQCIPATAQQGPIRKRERITA